MRTFLISLLLAVLAYFLYEQLKPIEISSTGKELKNLKNIGIKWNDSLLKHLPKNIDTSIIVKDSKGNSLKFSQYLKLVFNHEAIIFRDKNVWRLHRLTQESQDSLKKDDYALAANERWDAWRYPDTVSIWKTKMDQISHTLAQADHILVLKAKRKMIITRKGVFVKSFVINMGRNTVGNKIKDGDGRTPEGIYNVDQKYVRGDKYYKSFLITYPNNDDKLLAKKRGVKVGFGVSIHGTPEKKINSKDWTAGCIAMQNRDLDQLFDLISSGTTIEIIK